MTGASSRRGRSEIGLSSALALLTVAVVLVAALATAGLGRILVEQRRVSAAADLGALAAATAVQRGHDPCDAASRLTRLNAAVLDDCRVRDARVRVSARSTFLVWGRSITVRATALGGPR